MMRKGILVLGLCLLPVLAFAQDNTPPSASATVLSYARYEIVQSPLLVRLAIRLDRFTGTTWEFVTTSKGDFAWQVIPRVGAEGQTLVPGKVNCQLFASGIMAKVAILMNINTGQSWYIVEDPKRSELWRPCSNGVA